jgi:hypothetical protein
MDESQRTFYADLQSLSIEREALVRGALYQLQVDARDVAGLWLICRELIEAEGTMFPPSIADLALKTDRSEKTVNRRLALLVKVGIVRCDRDETASARDPKRRTIDWERTAKLARREVPTLPQRVAPLGHPDPTGSSSGQGDPTRPNETQREFETGSLFLDIYPPTPLEPKKPSEAAGAVLKVSEPERAAIAEPSAVEPAPASEPDGPTWPDVEAIVAAAGIGDRNLIRRARGRGVAPAEIARLVEVWRSQTGVGPGVLHGRIDRHQAGAAIAGFVAAEPVEFKLQRIEQRAELGRAERERIVDATTAAIDERVRLAALEAEHGAAIDAASQGELIEALNQTGRGFVVKALQKPGGRGSTIVRAELLAAWAELQNAAEVH